MSSTTSPQFGAKGLSVQVRDPEAQRIHFSWLVRLRWGAIAGQLAAIACAHFALDIALPLGWLGAILAASVVYNVACAVWSKRAASVGEPMIALTMGADVLQLTALLHLTGGPFNPFSFLYLVHIALAAVVLRSWWTWSLVALSLACFGALFLDTPPGAEMHGGAHAGAHAGQNEHAGHSHASHPHGHHQAHAAGPDEHAQAHAQAHGARAHGSIMDLHLQGMWIAFGIAAAFIVYFVSRVTRDLAAREAELLRVRAAAARNEKLAALATLAAGAAHELATPLSTIAVIAKELERSLVGQPGAVAEDVALIRQEIARCRGILQHMSVEAGQSGGDGIVQTRPERIVTLALDGLVDRARVDVELDPQVAERCLQLPEQALALALRGLLKNATEADPDGRVSLRVTAPPEPELREGCLIEIADRGTGMPAAVLERLGEPFFTTKEPGRGMGLGVFVARTLAEQIGGRLDIVSSDGQGTTVALRLPPCVETKEST